MTKCPTCENESRPGSRTCPQCGTDLTRVPPIYDDPDSDAKSKAMLCYGLAGMMGFFAFGFLLPGLLAEPGFLLVSLALVVVAFILFLTGREIKRNERRHIDQLRKEWLLRGKCEYCGTQNAPGEGRCVSCGAPLADRTG